MNPVLFSSKNEVWATPQDFFDKLNEEFRFTLDPCALPDNAKCKRFYTPEQDGLAQSWGGGGMFFATRHTAKVSIRGCKNAITKQRSLTLRSWLSYQLGRTQSGFTNTSTARRKRFALLRVGSSLAEALILLHFPLWLLYFDFEFNI